MHPQIESPLPDTAHLATVQSLSFLSGLKFGTLLHLVMEGRFQRFSQDETVFFYDQQPCSVYLVVDGLVALSGRGIDGRSHVVELFGKGRLFGDTGLIWGSHYGVWAYATEATVLQRIGCYATDSALLRVAGDLLSLAPPGGDADRVELPAAKRLIASMLNMSCEAFSRALRRLRENGLIAVAGSSIAILDRARLETVLHDARTAAPRDEPVPA